MVYYVEKKLESGDFLLRRVRDRKKLVLSPDRLKVFAETRHVYGVSNGVVDTVYESFKDFAETQMTKDQLSGSPYAQDMKITKTGCKMQGVSASLASQEDTTLRIPSYVTDADIRVCKADSPVMHRVCISGIEIPDSVHTLQNSESTHKDYNINNMFQFRVAELRIPKTVTKLGDNLFGYNYGAELEDANTFGRVVIGGGVEILPPVCFAYCAIDDLDIQEGCLEIGYNAFHGAALPGTVRLPNSLGVIRERAFHGASGVRCIQFGSGIRGFDQYAFAESSLREITIPENLQYMEASVFEKCRSLKKAILQKGVEETYPSMFSGCENLTDVQNIENVTRIADTTFYKCSKLTQLAFNPDMQSIGADAFNSSGIQELDLHFTDIASEEIAIGSEAFRGCKNLRTVRLRGGITNLGMLTFADCLNLESVDLTGTDLTVLDHNVFGNCQSLSEVLLPDNLGEIRDAFSSTPSLRTIMIPESVYRIYDYEFKSVQYFHVHKGSYAESWCKRKKKRYGYAE